MAVVRGGAGWTRSVGRAVAARPAIGVEPTRAADQADVGRRIARRATTRARYLSTIDVARALVVGALGVARDAGRRQAATVDAHRAIGVTQTGDRRARIVIARRDQRSGASRWRARLRRRSMVRRHPRGVDLEHVGHARGVGHDTGRQTRCLGTAGCAQRHSRGEDRQSGAEAHDLRLARAEKDTASGASGGLAGQRPRGVGIRVSWAWRARLSASLGRGRAPAYLGGW
jgi:hypothetical protein